MVNEVEEASVILESLTKERKVEYSIRQKNTIKYHYVKNIQTTRKR